MSLNSQIPYFYTLDGATSQVLTIINSRSVSVMTSGDTTDIQNSAIQNISLPDGATIELNCDGGNTLSQIVVTPASGATAYVVMIGGNGIVVTP
jgi:hypothetical protein